MKAIQDNAINLSVDEVEVQRLVRGKPVTSEIRVDGQKVIACVYKGDWEDGGVKTSYSSPYLDIELNRNLREEEIRALRDQEFNIKKPEGSPLEKDLVRFVAVG